MDEIEVVRMLIRELGHGRYSMKRHGADIMISCSGVEMRVCGLKPGRHKRATTRVKNGRKLVVIHKLDEEQVRWIVRTRRNGTMGTKEIAETMGISARWVQKLCKRYAGVDPSEIKYPEPMGCPVRSLPGRMEHSMVLNGRVGNRRSAVRLEKIIQRRTGIHIPHRTIHRILLDEDLALHHPAKSRQRKWVRYERRYSNSLWHTDYKQLPDGRWFIAYMDDASRFIVGFGVFDAANTPNALRVLKDAIRRHGKPYSVLTDHGSQFYANEKKNAERGKSVFEQELAELGIKHVMARIRHPQTNGKLERFHAEIERHRASFEEESMHNAARGVHAGDHIGSPFYTASVIDPVSRLVEWHNTLEHMSLEDGIETPAEAYERKQAPEGISDKEMEADIRGTF